MPSPRKIVLHRLTGRRRAVGALVAAAVALVVAALGVSSPAAAQTQPFTDISQDAYYSEAVGALAGGGVFDGTECAPGMLCPGEPIDRKTMAVWTVRALDGEDPAQILDSRFSDVAADSFHGPFIERMAELGVTTGCGDGTGFCPDDTVSRAHMAVFLTRAFDLDPGPDPGFSDVADDAWYYNHVAALAASRITAGCGDGTTFCPSRQTTRAQMATFLARALGLIQLPPERTSASASTYPVTIILPNTIVTVDRSGQRHTFSGDFTDSYGTTISASISPDGRHIAHTTADGAILVTDANGTATKQLTADSTSFLSWSPDSTRIAYHRSRSDVEPSGLFVTDRDGTHTIQLNDFYTWELSWSPDSTRIAFIHGDINFDIRVSSVDGTETLTIAQTEFNTGDAIPTVSWSPDGTRVAYTTSGSLSVSNADGTDSQDLISSNLDYEAASPSVAWSPDSSHIALSIGESNGHSSLVRVDGTHAIEVYDFVYMSEVTEAYILGWSRDGTLFAYGFPGYGYIVVLSTVENDSIPSIQEIRDRRSGLSFRPNPFGEFQEFSADGQKILHVSHESGTITVTGTDLESTLDNPDSVLSFNRQNLGLAVFSPDGMRVAFMNNDGVAVLDLSSGEESVVLDYADIASGVVSDRSDTTGADWHLCPSHLRWTQTGIQASAGICRTP